FNAFASAAFRTLSNKAAVGWTTGHHTGNPVGVYSVGAGAENFSRVFNNIELPGVILKTAGF
ncbi:MAG: alkaline phosphatase, partial [Muribaculaceae bacterium]|nr:alkaline phosphatase [Muribaculaceae bacterium]